MSRGGVITCLRGGQVLQGGRLVEQDVWVRDGEIVDQQQLFFKEQRAPDFCFDCTNHIIAPGFIDIQINGGWGLLPWHCH